MTARAYHGWHVAPVEKRHYNGVTYHSMAEANRAAELDLYFRQSVGFWTRQPYVQLGPDTVYRPDFLVCDKHTRHGTGPGYDVWFEEVKGFETAHFKRIRKLWLKYGPAKLMIRKRKRGGGWITETIEREIIKETEDGRNAT